MRGYQFSISDFCVCRTTGRFEEIPHGVLPANEVNSLLYRPLDLFVLSWRSVKPSPRFDVWAFGCMAFEVTAWLNPTWRRAGEQMRRLFGGLSMTPTNSAEQWRDDRIRRYSPRALIPILRACVSKSKCARASELVLQLEALAVVQAYVENAAAEAASSTAASVVAKS